MDVPAEIALKSTIRQGAVYYFIEESFSGKGPHYFVVLNKKPHLSTEIVMVYAVTLSLDVAQRHLDLGYNQSLVQVSKCDCNFLSKPTLFNCNTPIEKPISRLIEMLKSEKLRFSGTVSIDVLAKLHEGVILSEQVTEKLKKKIR